MWPRVLTYLRDFLVVLLVFGVVLHVLFHVFWTPQDASEAEDDSREEVFHYEETKLEGATVCKVNSTDKRTFARKENAIDGELAIIYFITPTHPRRGQVPELIRLSNTLIQVRKLHWIIADDSEYCNEYLDVLLNRIGIPYTHISSPMPDEYRNMKLVPRGVSNRLASLNWILKSGKKPCVIYFGDDDNTYDLRMFDEIRYTKRISMFPVGLIGQFAVSSPLVSDGKIIGFFDSYIVGRKWPIDMGSFAINLEYLEGKSFTMPYKAGFEEDEFLKSIGLKVEDIELKGNECTEVLAWHTQTKGYDVAQIMIDNEIVESGKTNLNSLLKSLKAMGVAQLVDYYGAQAIIGRNGKEIAISNKNFNSLISDELKD